MSELLRQVPGADKRFVYYLEAQGVIRPARLPKSRIDRRDYGEAEIGQVRRIWRYYRAGYALSAARELAEQDADARAFALVGAVARRRAEALDALRESDRVLEAAVVYGEQADLVVRLEASRDEDVFQALHPAFDRGCLTGLRGVLKTRSTNRVRGPALPNGAEKGRRMQAFVLLRVPAKQVDRTLERLSALAGIVEASAVYGETDIIAKLDVADQAELDDLVIRKIQDLPEVEATRTFIVVGGLQWTRGSTEG